jgi:hypothetical protein
VTTDFDKLGRREYRRTSFVGKVLSSWAITPTMLIVFNKINLHSELAKSREA